MTRPLPSEVPGKPGTHRLLLSTLGFIGFETLFIWLLGERIYDFGFLNPVHWLLIALAAAGYFSLGYFSRSWLSGLALAAPLLVAFYFVNVVWTTQYANGASLTENANFTQIWLNLSLLFVPAWGMGVLGASRMSGRQRHQTS